MDTFDLLKALLSAKIKDTVEITPGSTMKNLGVDSLDLVEVVLSIEEQLDLTFEDNELLELVTVQDVLDLVERKK